MSWTGGKAAREDRTGIPSPGSRQAMEATGAEGDVSADSRLKGVQVALQNVLWPFHLQLMSWQTSQPPFLQTRQETCPASYAERVFILF